MADRNRPYDGQLHTHNGERGKTLVAGLTFRDVKDCFIKGALLACGGQENLKYLYERAKQNTWVEADIYKIPWEQIDPLAVWQNMSCEMERMMGIFPNVPKLYVDWAGAAMDDVKLYLDQRAQRYGTKQVEREVKAWLAGLRTRTPGQQPERRRVIPRKWVYDAFQKQGNRCFYCDNSDIGQMEGDHLVPLARGGKHNRHNIVAACSKCNREKGAMMPLEFVKQRCTVMRAKNGEK